MYGSAGLNKRCRDSTSSTYLINENKTDGLVKATSFDLQLQNRFRFSISYLFLCSHKCTPSYTHRNLGNSAL